MVTLVLGLFEFLEHLADGFGALFLQVSRHRGVLLRRLGLHLLDTQILQQLLLGFDQFADRLITEVDRLDDILLGQLVASCLHHHHTFRGAGDDQIKIPAFHLAVARIEDEVIAEEAHPHGRHRAVEGDTRQQCGNRGTGHCQYIRRDPFVQRETGGHHLKVIPEPTREQRPHRPVNQTGCEGGALRGPTFTALVAARDPSCGVQPLFVIADQRQKIDAFASAGAGGGHQDGGIATFNENRSARLGGKSSGGQSNLASVKGDRLGLSLHDGLCPLVNG